MLVILLGVDLNQVWPIELGLAFRRPSGTGWVVMGAILGLWPVLLLRRSGHSENPWKPTARILELGPFRIIRDPMYLQMLLV